MKIDLSELKTKSNLISIFRIFLAIPIFYFIDNINNPEINRAIVLSLFFLAYITDILDGYLARKYNQVTEMGKIIDPLADKIVVAVVVIKFYMDGLIPEYYFWIIIGRDVIIFIGGIFVSKKIGKVLPSNKVGKITVISIALFFITVAADFQNSNPSIYYWMMNISLFLSFLSIIAYGIRGFDAIKWSKNETV